MYDTLRALSIRYSLRFGLQLRRDIETISFLLGALEELRLKLGDMIDEGKDSVLFYTVSNPKWLRKRVLGVEKSAPTRVV